MRFVDFIRLLCENPRKRLVFEENRCWPYLFAGRLRGATRFPSDGCFPISWQQRRGARIGVGLTPIVLVGAVLLAVVSGWTDLHSRRIPNWVTVPGFVLGVGLNTFVGGRAGLVKSLLGTLLGLGLLLLFVLLRSLGAGDWKLAGALGAFTGPGLLMDLLILSVFVAGVMAAALIVYKGRVRQTLRNIGHILVSLVTFHLPGARVSLDNPDALKVPYGVALALTVLVYAAAHLRGVV